MPIFGKENVYVQMICKIIFKISCLTLQNTPPQFLDQPQMLGLVIESVDESSQMNGVPQNLLEALGLDCNWDIYNDFSQDNSTIVTTEVPQHISQQQNELETVTEIPIEVVCGVFQKPVSTYDHPCTPGTYKTE